MCMKSLIWVVLVIHVMVLSACSNTVHQSKDNIDRFITSVHN